MHKDDVQDILSKYTYNRKAGKELSLGLEIFKGVHRQNNTLVCIKVLKAPSQQLIRYLQKLRDTKSEYLIKIFDLASSTDRTVAIFQDAPYGTLMNALAKCRRLEDSDAIFVAKSILYGYIDLLRNGGNWSGTFNDIEITDAGLKLSWNGTEPSSGDKPIPKLIEKICARDPTEQKGLLPFPQNRQITDLIKVSNENASEMSVHPLLKKRDKIFKKKGKGWLAIKQTKNKNEYFDEIIYLAVSPVHGFIRVKMYDQGQIDRDAIALNKTKNTFTWVIEDYDDGTQTFIISDYANDGNLQQYINKLKAANIRLKEDQIEFFLYSLFDTIKQVQQSSLQSINSMHIRNIFIENGVPKIGEPVPTTVKMEGILRDKFNVPDFYHPKYKNAPNTRDPSYDTYSLGILLYKLMYTEYPIFPEGKVHIPIAPAYNQRIKTTLEIFLNQGGKLADIESRIEVSDTVKKQIKENKVKLEVQKIKSNKNINIAPIQISGAESNNNLDEIDGLLKDNNLKQQNCWKALCETINQDHQAKITHSFYIECENSPLKKYRICTKIIFIVLFYILVFYLWFLSHVFDLFVKTSVFQSLNVSITSQNYTIITADSYSFYTLFNATSAKDYNSLINTLKCTVDSTNITYSTYVKNMSVGWILYLALGLIAFGNISPNAVLLIFLKVLQLGYLDTIRAMFNYQTRSQNFNITTYVVFNLVFSLTLFSHYFMFNYIFDDQTTPCFGGDSSLWFSSTISLFTNRNYVLHDITQMLQYIMPPTISCFILLILNFVQVLKHERLKYSKLFNPILLFLPFLLALTVLMRIGVFTPFKPSWINYSIWVMNIRNTNYITVIGMFPEILVLIQHVIAYPIDWVFWRCLDRKIKTLIMDGSISDDLREANQV